MTGARDLRGLDRRLGSTSPRTPAAGSGESARFVRNYLTDLPVLRDLLPQIKTPVYVLASARDPDEPDQQYVEFLVERLPRAEFDGARLQSLRLGGRRRRLR